MKLRLLMLIIILPTIALAAYYAMQLVNHDQAESAAAHRAHVKSAEQARINDLIHELQKERGYSAGFISSVRQNFPSELRSQRTSTDASIAPAINAIPETAARKPAELAEISEMLEDLDQMRSQVDALAVSVPQMAGYYTGMINALLLIAKPFSGEGQTAELRDLEATRSYVSAAKESAGLERAMGATGLGGGFSVAVAERFLRLQGAQQALLNQAARHKEGSGWKNALYGSEEFLAISEARGKIAEGQINGDFGGLTAGQWFQISSDWIEYLRTQEQDHAALIEELANAIDVEIQERLNRNIWVGIVSVIVVFIGAVASFEYMTLRIKKLTKVVEGFAKGDFSQWVPGIKYNDEISAMARSIYKFKQETLALRREALAIKEAEEASLNAKHGRVVDLVTEGLAALAQADLSIRFQEELDGEYDQIRQDFNDSAQRLCSVLSEIMLTVGELGQSSEQMNASAVDLATRTVEQVETIRTTTGQVTTLSSDVDEFGQEVTSAAEEAAMAKEMVDRSAQLMGEVDQAMERIKGSSEEIGNIISMIDDIAFQTNLLALNAGVEAARAGQAGRGFAVVASEVGNLAQRASQATLDIKTLVEDSGTHVSAGVELVERTGKSLHSIADKITQVDDVLIRVSEGSRMHVSQLKELAEAMNRISGLTDQNTIMADETQRSSGEIATRSQRLATLIDDFRLEDGRPHRQVA